MRRLTTPWMAALAFVLVASAARAADYHHIHLNAPDPPEAARWYAAHLGGEAIKGGFFSPVRFGKITVLFFKAKPGFEGSVGSSVDHIGFAYKDLDAKLAELEKDGVKITAPAKKVGPIKFAFIEDPWGTSIELVEDAQIDGLHHIHLAATDPQATLKWYHETFGGEMGKLAGILPGVRYGDVWLLAKKVNEPQAPTKGRSIDHLGWGFADLVESAKELKAKGVKFETEPTSLGTVMFGFVEGPEGVRIEVVGPPPKKK